MLPVGVNDDDDDDDDDDDENENKTIIMCFLTRYRRLYAESLAQSEQSVEVIRNCLCGCVAGRPFFQLPVLTCNGILNRH